jgi:hypothetical protein
MSSKKWQDPKQTWDALLEVMRAAHASRKLPILTAQQPRPLPRPLLLMLPSEGNEMIFIDGLYLLSPKKPENQ